MKVTNREELDQAMAKLVEIRANKAKVDADLNQDLADVRDGYANEYLMPWETGAVHVDQVQAEIEQAIEGYFHEHHDELLGDKAKSIKLTHGVIGLRKGKDKIEEIDLTDKQRANGALAKCVAAVVSTVQALAILIGKCDLTQVIRVNVEWDKPAILKAVEAKQITEAKLKANGLRLVPGLDKFYIETKAEKVDAKTPSTA